MTLLAAPTLGTNDERTPMMGAVMKTVWFAARFFAILILSCSWAIAQTSEAPYTSQGQGETTSSNTVPTRTQDKLTTSGDTSTETHVTQRQSINGGYEPYEESQKQTVKVDANTTKTVEKRFGKGPGGEKVLLQVIEQETRTSPTGQSVTRTVFNPDVNGALSVTRREVEKTTRTGPDKQEKSSTLLLPDANGGFSPTLKTHEVDTLDSKGNVTQYTKSVSAPGDNGGWRTTEMTQGTAKSDGNQVTKEERVFRPNTDGQLTLAERKVTKETKDSNGDQRTVQETYSTMLGGAQPYSDGGLHLDKRVVEVQKRDASGKEIREQQVEQRSPAAEGGGLQTTQKTIDIVRPASEGVTKESRSIQASDGNGGLQNVWVYTKTTEKAPAVTVDTKAKTDNKANTSPAGQPKTGQTPPPK